MVVLNVSSVWLYRLINCPRFVRTKGNIREVKYCLRRKKRVAARKLCTELGISDRIIRQMTENYLRPHSYKIVIEPLFSDDQKIKRKQFANWIRTNFQREDTMRILFSDEKFFHIDGVYNSQNNRASVVSRTDADEKGGIQERQKFPQKVTIWVGACSKSVTPLVILNE